MDLTKLVSKLTDKDFNKKSRKVFVKELNHDLEQAYKENSYTYGEFDSKKHGFEFQLVINADRHPDMIHRLKQYAMDSGFKMSAQVNGLDVFIYKMFKTNKLFPKFTKLNTKYYRITKVNARLSDPRRFVKKYMNGIDFQVHFVVVPKAVDIKK